MNGLSLQTSYPAYAPRPAQAARPALPVEPAPLTAAEQAQIADAFPERPAVTQRLYGPGRTVQTAPQLGGRLDLSA